MGENAGNSIFSFSHVLNHEKGRNYHFGYLITYSVVWKYFEFGLCLKVCYSVKIELQFDWLNGGKGHFQYIAAASPPIHAFLEFH